MGRRFWVVVIVALMVVPFALVGCKGKTEKVPDEMKPEDTVTEAIVMTEEASTAPIVTEPAQMVAAETIPPTAAPQVQARPEASPVVEKADRNKDIQKALNAAGFYNGSIDGKIGPKTKSAIQEFQRSRGLKVDGKVGPMTWAELEKYLKS